MCRIIISLLQKNIVCDGDFVSCGWEVKWPVIITPTCLFRIANLIYSLKHVG